MVEESENQDLIRVALLGDPSVGKTCILYQLYSSQFKDEYAVLLSSGVYLTFSSRHMVSNLPL